MEAKFYELVRDHLWRNETFRYLEEETSSGYGAHSSIMSIMSSISSSAFGIDETSYDSVTEHLPQIIDYILYNLFVLAVGRKFFTDSTVMGPSAGITDDITKDVWAISSISWETTGPRAKVVCSFGPHRYEEATISISRFEPYDSRYYELAGSRSFLDRLIELKVNYGSHGTGWSIKIRDLNKSMVGRAIHEEVK